MNLSKSKIFLIFCLAFVVGVWTGPYLNFEIMAIAAMIFIILGSINYSDLRFRIIGIAGIILILGSWYVSVYDKNNLAEYFDKNYEITGVVVDEPDKRADKTYLTLGKLVVNEKPIDSKLLLTVSRFPEYEYGDQLSFKEKIAMPKDAPKGEFSYRNYLARFGIEGLVYYPKINLIGSRQANNLKYYIFKLKQKFTDNISQVLTEPHNSFTAGILVGERRSIPSDLLEQFNKTGTTHIIAISGYNITIIAWALDKLLQRFGRRISFITSLICIVAFVVLTGASSSVIRAGVMGALGLVALNIGRVYAITNALAFTGVVMLLANPLILHFDVGFQLSFAALLGLVYLTPILEEYFLFIPKFIRQILLATISAQIFTLPILLYNFDRLSVIAPITNLLVLMVIPFAMLFGFAAGIVGFISQTMSAITAWVVWLLLSYVLKVIELTAAIPFASINFGVDIWFVFIFYTILAITILAYYYSEKLQLFKWKREPKTQSNL